MNILALGDPHGKLPRNIDSIVKKNKVDIIVCVGDFAFTPDKPWLEESWKGVSHSFVKKTYKDVVDKICSFNLPVLALRGNMFISRKRRREADKILRRHENLINKFLSKANVFGRTFIFFDVLYEKHNTRTKKSVSMTKGNKSKERRLNKLLKENPGSILITHNPPYGHVDAAYNGEHVGSKIIFRAIKKHQPKIVLCGHIHEAKGESKIGKTKVYNLGCCGDYKIINISNISFK
jgi:uncharacterized protein